MLTGRSLLRGLEHLKAINENGDKVTVTKDVRIPPLSTYFEYGFTEVEGSGDCQVQIDINYQAVDLITPETPISKSGSPG